ncbi:unnamed protein product [Orchesella dallaii]|uniref:Uncharacterized protein n=1 Tax=Orchesella dallaii TaxID=48710 RepID=A0ABP1QVL7_9HEXA
MDSQQDKTPVDEGVESGQATVEDGGESQLEAEGDESQARGGEGREDEEKVQEGGGDDEEEAQEDVNVEEDPESDVHYEDNSNTEEKDASVYKNAEVNLQCDEPQQDEDEDIEDYSETENVVGEVVNNLCY